MLRALRRVTEVFTIRAAPGLINLAALFIISHKLGSDGFGYYSTTIASAAMLGSIILGPILYGIMPESGERKEQKAYLHYLGLIITSIIGLLILAAFGAAFSPIFASAIFATASSGAMAVLKEVLRSQLRFWAWGAVTISQAALFVWLVWGLPLTAGPESAIWYFGISHVAATALAYALLGFPLPRIRGLSLLKRNVGIGSTYTLSIAFEALFGLGTRYLIAIWGSPELLSIFSFCLDLAERVIGFLVNAAGFLAVPTAFKRSHADGEKAFLRTLHYGALWGGVAAIVSLFILLIASHYGWLPGKSQQLVDPGLLFWIGLAVTVNRLKKICIDPAAMKAGRTHVILRGYLWAAPVTLMLQAAALQLLAWLIGPILLCGYIAASAIAWRSYSRSLPSQKILLER